MDRDLLLLVDATLCHANDDSFQNGHLWLDEVVAREGDLIRLAPSAENIDLVLDVDRLTLQLAP